MDNKTDFGPCPFVVDIEYATTQNEWFRRALWTGCHLQLTLMSIPTRSDIGWEVHPDTDQFLRCEEGCGTVFMGCRKYHEQFKRSFHKNDAIFVPAGYWHNVVNTGDCPLKLYSIYAPPHHPHGTIHRTKEDAEAAESAGPAPSNNGY